MNFQPIPEAKIAARAFLRVLAARTEGLDEFHEADRQFDAGEYSDHFHGLEIEKIQDSVNDLILSHFPEVPQTELDYAIGYLENMPVHFMLESQA